MIAAINMVLESHNFISSICVKRYARKVLFVKKGKINILKKNMPEIFTRLSELSISFNNGSMEFFMVQI